MPQIRPITDLRNTNEISDLCHARREPYRYRHSTGRSQAAASRRASRKGNHPSRARKSRMRRVVSIS